MRCTAEYCDGLVKLLHDRYFFSTSVIEIAIGIHVDMPDVRRVISVPYTIMEDFFKETG